MGENDKTTVDTCIVLSVIWFVIILWGRQFGTGPLPPTPRTPVTVGSCFNGSVSRGVAGCRLTEVPLPGATRCYLCYRSFAQGCSRSQAVKTARIILNWLSYELFKRNF